MSLPMEYMSDVVMDGPLPLRISGAENPIVPPMHPLYMLSLLADSPKSMMRAAPFPVTIILSGLRSLCIIPLWCR